MGIMLPSLERLAAYLLSRPRAIKRAVVLALDAVLCILTVWLAFYLRLGLLMPLSGPIIWTALASVTLALPIFTTIGLYRAIFRYSGLSVMLAVARAMLFYGFVFAAIFTFWGVEGVPRTVGIIQPILLLLLISLSRAAARVLLGERYRTQLCKAVLPQALIYGAGSAGRQLASAMANSVEIRIVGFLDDDDRLHGHVLNGLLIHSPADLNRLLLELPITDILLALPSASPRRRYEILDTLKGHKLAVRTLPSLSDLATGKVSLSNLKDLDIDDLLGRETVKPNHVLLTKNIIGKVVLVTGAGGSIGSELCRQILAVGPMKLLLIEQSEFALYAIHQELEEKLSEKETILIPLLASIQDEDRMRVIMSTWHPDTIYHAAAYKHVPLVEHNPVEGIKNNVIGTLRLAQVSAEHGVDNFVLISTDKAVRPTNIMGASKRLAEMVLQALAATNSSETTFSMVRFGNVLGSSGSVVPKFRQQIKQGGPITITHPEITRYFMTIPEAAQLVIQAGAMAKGGDVFLLDMGQSIKIIDLACRMVELSGLTIRNNENPNGDIEIEISGLRPGEKLFEELLISDKPKPTQHSKIMKAVEDFIPWSDLENFLEELRKALSVNDVDVVRQIMVKLVPGFVPNIKIVDWVFVERDAN